MNRKILAALAVLFSVAFTLVAPRQSSENGNCQLQKRQ